MTFESDIRGAFVTGNLTDPIQIQQAMQYENLIGTLAVAANLHSKLIAHSEWPTLDSAEPVPAAGNNGNPPLFSDIREDIVISGPPGHQVSYIKPIQSLVSADPTFNVPDVVDAIAKLGIDKAERAKRRKRGGYLWESCFPTDRLIWISELPKLPTLELSDVLQSLGLYHLESRMANEPFVQFLFKTNQCFKPSWVDASLAFYFDAAPMDISSGLTRNLANGTSGFREWVTRKANLTLLDVRVWLLDKGVAFHKPSAVFWSKHANRIEAMR